MLSAAFALSIGVVAVDPSVAVLVGMRIGDRYSTVWCAPSAAEGMMADSAQGLLVPTDGGLMFVDVVSDCRNEVYDQKLVIHRVTDQVGRVRCATRPAASRYEGYGRRKVLFASGRYLSVFRYGESWNGRGSWYVDICRWGEGRPIPMSRLLPKAVVGDIDRSARERRKRGIADALLRGVRGDADPCYYPDASHRLWGLTRAGQRWVVMALLKSECTTDEWVTPVPVPSEVLDGDGGESPERMLPTKVRAEHDDVVVSPDGRLALVIDGGAVMLKSVGDMGSQASLAGVDLSVPDGQIEKALVMVKWIGSRELSKWRTAIDRAMKD